VALLVLAGPGGTPGVTATALALTLAWRSAAVMAECDPAGGSVLAGLWRGHTAPGSGLLPRLALAAQEDPGGAASTLLTDALPLEQEPTRHRVLPSAASPSAARALAPAWPALAAAFSLAPHDVIADTGRFDGVGPLRPLLASASLVLLVCRPTLRQAAAAKPRLEELASVRPADGLLIIGDGSYGPAVMASELGVPLTGTLPSDPATASVLADGTPAGRRFSRSALMQAAAGLARDLAADLAGGPGPIMTAEMRR
jgi:hypothetical protein